MKKRILSAFLAAVLCMGLWTPSAMAEGVWASPDANTPLVRETPAPQATLIAPTSEEAPTRQTLNFNPDWRFYLGDVPGGEGKDYDDSAWRSLSLPHDWSIELDFNENSPSTPNGGCLDGGIGWYRKSFVLPSTMAGKQISLAFGGVYMDSTTYVNGTMVGNYPYGYSTFAYDITDQVVADGVTQNVVAIKVNNRQKSSRWYSGSGIYRNVNMVVTEPVHVNRYGTFVTTPGLEAEYANNQAVVNIKTEVRNDGAAAADNVVVKSTIYDAIGGVFAATAVTEPKSAAQGAVTEFEQNITTAKPQLWGIERATCYKLVTEVVVGSVVTDTYETTFGFRWFAADNDDGFSLNGEYMKLNGVCMHHDQGALGAVANYRAIERQMQMMKDMGVNSIRVTHNPAADELLDICNRLGLLVIDEAFDCWESGKSTYDYGRFFTKKATHPDATEGQTWAEFDIKNMVDRGKNDPSIIMWSIGNEIGGATVPTATNLHNWVKEVDSTRLTTQGYNNFIDGFDKEWDYAKVADVTDVAGFNYGEKNATFDTAHTQFPDWVIAGTETSSAVRTRGYYKIDNDKHICTSYDEQAVGWGSTMEKSWQRNRDRKWILGEYMWTGFDYIGEPTPYGWWPSKNAYFGTVDTAGIPKDAFYMYQSVWTSVEENPMVHLMPHWNWDGDAGYDIKNSKGEIRVLAYSNAPSVGLYLNNELISKQTYDQFTTDYGMPYQEKNEHIYLEWMVPYAQGELKAVAYDKDGEVIATDIICTSGTPAQIRLTPDREVITADGLDLSYILVEVLDSNGNLVPTADNLINFQLSGNGAIVGVDNGNQTAVDERYKDNKRKAFSGKAMVIVQSTPEAGPISITATSAGLISEKTMVFTSGSSDKTLLGYQAIPGVETLLNTQPILPGVDAVYSDGTRETKAVTWDEITSVQLGKPGQFTAEGTVVDTEDRVSVIVTVVAIIGVRDVSIVTGVGTVPTLPSKVTAVYNTGGTEEVDVVWDRILTAADVAQAGTLTIEGTATGVAQKATAMVRVTETAVADKDVAKREGTYPIPTASNVQNNGNNPATGINDGNIPYIGGDKNHCWIPWGHNEADEWCQLEFETSITTHKVGVDFWFDPGDAQMCIPDALTVQYSTDGNTWDNVQNQSISLGTDMKEKQENVITFDEVTAKYIRFALYDEAKLSPGISEMHVYVEETIIPISTTAVLVGISMGDAPLEGFAENTLNYVVDLPYGAEVPEVTATAKDNATVFIVPAMDADKATVITVTSEDGRTAQRYIVQFRMAAPILDTAEISLENTSLTEDDIKPVTLAAKLQDGSTLSNSVLEVSYEVGDRTIAEVKEGNVNAYNEGTTTIQATVTHQGVTVKSNSLTITVAKSSETKTILSYEKVTAVTDKGLEPQLPATVVATFDNGLAKPVQVEWDTIPAEKYADYGEFTVQGSVVGQALKPTATVLVKGVAGVQQFSVATPVRFIPDLPAKALVYFSDGTRDELPIFWDECTQDTFGTDGETVTVSGTVGNVSRAAGAPLTTSITVRVSADIENPPEPFTMYKNGFYLPLPFASYTNEGASGNGVAKIYDHVTTSNTVSNDPGQNCWNNWVTAARPSDFVGIVFGYEEIFYKFVDNLNIYFYSDSGVAVPASCEIQYYIGPSFERTDLPQDPQNSLKADHFLSKDENWTAVTGLNAPETLESHKNSAFTFDAVQTCAIRVKMTAQPNKSLGIIEMQSYARQVRDIGEATDLTEISIDGTPLADFDPEKLSYTYAVESDTLPVVTATAGSHNEAVTVLSPVLKTVSGGAVTKTASVIVTAENGVNAKTYVIEFTVPDVPTEVYDVTVASADHGTVTADPERAEADATVTLTIAPDSVYELGSITAHGTEEPHTTVALAGTDNTRTFTMPDYGVTVTATFRKTADQKAVEMAKTLIEGGAYTVAQADANTEDDVKTWIVTAINALDGMNITGISVTADDVTVTACTPAEADPDGESGSDGSFSFTAVLTKGDSTAVTDSVNGIITKTAYVPEGVTAAPVFTHSTMTFADAETRTVAFLLSGAAVETYTIYAAAEGGEALFDPAVSAEENTLTLTFAAQPDADTIYYISATEGDKVESTRTAVTVKPYEAPKSDAKAITAFSIVNQVGETLISETGHTIAVTMPIGADVTALIPTITVSEHASVDPNSGIAQNFTSAVVYTVTAENDTTQAYTVTVTVEAPNIIPVERVEISQDSANIYVGNTAQFTVRVKPENATNKDVIWKSSDETVATVGETGLVTAMKDGVAIITVTTEDGSFTDTCSVTVETYYSTYTPPADDNKTEIIKNEDGSTTKIVTDKKTGTVTATTTRLDGSKEVVVTKKDGAISTTDTRKDGVKTDTVTTPEGNTTATVAVPKNIKKVTVTIPTPQKPGVGTVAVIINADGTQTVVKNSVATETGMTITLTEGAKLELVDNSKTFADVAGGEWYADAVQFATSRELFEGVGVGRFEAATPMNRAMLMTVLYRYEGTPVEGNGNAWYADALQWAVDAGITDGTNPEAQITREQLATILFRYAKGEATQADISGFADAGGISDYAKEAMAWAVENSIIQGSGNNLNPKHNATRGEVAIMLQRFVALDRK